MRGAIGFTLLVLGGCGDDEKASDVADTVQETVADTVQETVADTTETNEVVAKTVLLDFRHGNQVVGSTLKIHSTGESERTERVCCPPTTTDEESPTYDTAALAALEDDIASIIAANETASESLGVFPDGSSVGELTVWKEDVAYVVMAYENRDGDRVRVTSVAEEARLRVLALVNEVVDQDMN